jgi:Protein of unknown function (DUF3579)
MRPSLDVQATSLIFKGIYHITTCDAIGHEAQVRREFADATLAQVPKQPGVAQKMASPSHYSFIIAGVTSSGAKFRPSDWAERLCGIMSAFGSERRMTYSPYVQPGRTDGETCVFVDVRIRDIESKAYDFLLSFAADNDLKTLPWEPHDNGLG